MQIELPAIGPDTHMWRLDVVLKPSAAVNALEDTNGSCDACIVAAPDVRPEVIRDVLLDEVEFLASSCRIMTKILQIT